MRPAALLTTKTKNMLCKAEQAVIPDSRRAVCCRLFQTAGRAERFVVPAVLFFETAICKLLNIIGGAENKFLKIARRIFTFCKKYYTINITTAYTKNVGWKDGKHDFFEKLQN